MRNNKYSMVIVTLLALVLATAAHAADTASLIVTVNDVDGIIPKASVVLSSEDNETIKRFSNVNGEVVFESLPAGSYSILVSRKGYEKFRETIELTPGESRELAVTLVMPQFSDSITITTANRREEVLKNVAEPVSVITRAEIETSGASNAKELLVDHVGAGVQVENGGGLGHVSINGVSQKGVLMLINGRRILGKNGNGEFSLDDLDINNIERVEVVKGAGSALYGSDAIAGVINLITREPESYGLTVDSRVSAGGNEDYQASSSIGYRSANTTASLTGSYRDYGGYDLLEDTKVTEGQPESEFYQAGADFEHSFNERLTLRGMFNYNQRNVDNFFREDFMRGSGYFETNQEITRVTASPEIEYLLGDSTVINARYNYSDYYREEERTFGTVVDEQQPWQEWVHEGQLTMRHLWNFGGNSQTLQLGYEYRDENMDRENVFQPGMDGNLASRDINVIWGQNEFAVTDAFTVTLGFRYDDYSDFGSEFSPKASAIFRIDESNRVRATYGHGFRAPNFGELYLDLGFFFKGNPDLQPEISDNFTVGWSHTSSRISGSIDYFYNALENGIIFDLSSFPFSYINLDELTVQGFNADVAVKLPYGFVPSASYSYTRRENAEGEEIDNYPSHSATFKLTWNAPQYDLNASIRGIYNGEVTYNNGSSRPSYNIWYLHAEKQVIRSESYGIGLFVNVDNLLDETDFFERDPSGTAIANELLLWFPRRTATIGLTIDFDSF